MKKQVSNEEIAELCHEVNKAYCEMLGDNSQLSWKEAPQWQRESALNGVEFHLANPLASASASHDSWMKEKIEAGWVYGTEKDPEKKTHHCIVPFEELPHEQQMKDYLFKSIVSLGIAINNSSIDKIEFPVVPLKLSKLGTLIDDGVLAVIDANGLAHDWFFDSEFSTVFKIIEPREGFAEGIKIAYKELNSSKNQTLGEKRVHLSFNPSSDSKIDQFKKMMAEAIDFCNSEIVPMINDVNHPNNIESGEINRCLNIAMTHLETAQMFGVKAIAKNLK